MERFLLVPDSFMGSMTSREICQVMKEEILAVWPGAEVVSIPVADGGEGSVDAFLAAVKGEKVWVDCQGPYGETVHAYYGRLPDGTAIIEMAAAVGLPMVGESKHADQTTTFGVGQLILAAARAGAKQIILGLGGSATNDGGVGAAAALGVRFKRTDGSWYIPVGGTLNELAEIDVSGLAEELLGVEVIAMCDIDNPLCGPSGASAIFGPQKGADQNMVRALDSNLAHLADVAARCIGKDLRDMAGAGAGGGMGFGIASFLNGKLQSGIETILDVTSFDELLDDADMVLTGEGKLDTQSLRGKVVVGVARRCMRKDVPVVAIVGDIGDDIGAVYENGISCVLSINRVALPFSAAKERSRHDMRLTVNNLMRFVKRMERWYEKKGLMIKEEVWQ